MEILIQTRSTAVSAHIGGIFAGLCVGYWVLNKFQESWGEKLYEESGNFTNISPEEIRCCNSKLGKILEYNIIIIHIILIKIFRS